MNANTKGTLFVKADRANDRVDEIANVFLNTHSESISRKDFIDFIKTVHLIINTEFNEKGVERKWQK